MAVADIICLEEEIFDTTQDLVIFDPISTWKKTKFKANTYKVRELLVKVFENGKCIYKLPSLNQIKTYAKQEKETMWPETKRLINPHNYYVDLSDKLWNLKHKLINEYRK